MGLGGSHSAPNAMKRRGPGAAGAAVVFPSLSFPSHVHEGYLGAHTTPLREAFALAQRNPPTPPVDRLPPPQRGPSEGLVVGGGGALGRPSGGECQIPSSKAAGVIAATATGGLQRGCHTTGRGG